MSGESRPDSVESAVLERLIRPQLADMTPEAARAVLKLRLDDRDRDRVHELSTKAQGGTLTVAEEAELDFYRHLGRVIEYLWSKARQSLKTAGLEVVSSRDA